MDRLTLMEVIIGYPLESFNYDGSYNNINLLFQFEEK